MTTSSDPAPYRPRHAASDPTPDPPLSVLADAEPEIARWQEIIYDIAQQHHASPEINMIRYESATRAMAPLDQLQARVREMLDDLGVPYPDRDPLPGGHPRRPRRWPIELAGVTEAELENLRDLSYAQLHALAMADHPDEVEELAQQWHSISRAAWRRGTRLMASMIDAPDALCIPLAQLADEYWAFAARTDHYAKTFGNAAQTHREARTKLEELGPP